MTPDKSAPVPETCAERLSANELIQKLESTYGNKLPPASELYGLKDQIVEISERAEVVIGSPELNQLNRWYGRIANLIDFMKSAPDTYSKFEGVTLTRNDLDCCLKKIASLRQLEKSCVRDDEVGAIDRDIVRDKLIPILDGKTEEDAKQNS